MINQGRFGSSLSRSPYSAALVLSLLSSACGMFNSDDAVLPADTVQKLAAQMEKSSVLARSSGEATRMRLKALFPAGSNTILNSADFAFEGAAGINRTFGMNTRPYESVAQIALRLKVADLCTTALPNSSPMFQLEKLADEEEITDIPLRKSLAVARKVWLHPYQASDNEVQALKELYEKTLAASGAGGGESGANKALCMAALLAPQFWLGNPKKSDVARGISIDLFLRVPSLQELVDFEAGKFTAPEYFDILLKQNEAQASLKNNLRKWHEEWLGLRNFLGGVGINMEKKSPRISGLFQRGNGPSHIYPVVTNVDGSVVGSTPIAKVALAGAYNGAACKAGAGMQAFDPESSFFAWSQLNTFTNRRDFLGGWIKESEIATLKTHATWGPDNGLARNMVDHVCNPASDQTYVSVSNASERWVRCRALISLSPSVVARKPLEDLLAVMTLIQTRISDPQVLASTQRIYLNDLLVMVPKIRAFSSAAAETTPVAQRNALVAAMGTSFVLSTFNSAFNNFRAAVESAAAVSGSSVYWEMSLADMTLPGASAVAGSFEQGTGRYRYYASSLTPAQQVNGTVAVDSPITRFTAADRSVRRYGSNRIEQNGYSLVTMPYTGAQVAVCNSVERFMLSCFSRNPANARFGVPEGAALGTGGSGSGTNHHAVAISDGSGRFNIDSMLHPEILTGYLCGPVNVAAMDQQAQGLNSGFSRGSVSSLNPYATNATFSFSGTATQLPEAQVAAEQYRQLEEEPYQLIEHLIFEGRDYRELMTADYTVGTPCLEALYEGQGYHLPPGTHPTCQPGGGVSTFKISPSKSIRATRILDWRDPAQIQGTMPALSRVWANDGGPKGAELWRREFPARSVAGVLTMPAFVTPVSNSTRGIAARYFARMLCDQPTFYDPEKDGGLSLHKSFVSNRGEATGNRHLKEECFTCHKNLDPLSSALSWGFINLIGKGGGEGTPYDFASEFASSAVAGGVMVGLRHGGGPEGDGAFMGEAVRGIDDLGRSVAHSRKFSECVVSTTFQYVYGRPVQMADIKLFKQLTDRFMDPAQANYRYLDLIRLMLSSATYNRQD